MQSEILRGFFFDIAGISAYNIGLIAFAFAGVAFMLIPLFDRSDLVAPAHKRPLFFVWFWVLVADLIVLSIYGKLPTGGINDWIGFYASLLFLVLFIIALPVITILERKRG